MSETPKPSECPRCDARADMLEHLAGYIWTCNCCSATFPVLPTAKEPKSA